MELLTTEFIESDPPVLQVAGEIDISTAEQLRGALKDAIAADSKAIVDMKGVTFCDAAGIRVVLQTAATLNGVGPLRLIHASRVSRLLALVGLDESPSLVVMDDGGEPDAG